jgi:hypothetical protein
VPLLPLLLPTTRLTSPRCLPGKTEVLDYYSLTQFKKGDTIAFLAASFCFWWVVTWLALAHVRHHRR